MGAAVVAAVAGLRENRSPIGVGDAPQLRRIVRITPSATYGVGGEICDVSALLPSKCYTAEIVGYPDGIPITDLFYRLTPGPNGAPNLLRLRATVMSTQAQVAAGVDLHTVPVLVEIRGR